MMNLNFVFYIIDHSVCNQLLPYKKDVLKNFAKFTRKHLCQSLFFNKVADLQAQVLSCEFCESFKNTFLREHLRTAASV